jgi:neprilysin
VKVLADQQQVILRGVLEEPITNDNNDNEATKKAKAFYKSCMDLRKLFNIKFLFIKRL